MELLITRGQPKLLKSSLPLLLYQLPACRAFLVSIVTNKVLRTRYSKWRTLNMIRQSCDGRWYVLRMRNRSRDKLTAILFPVLRCDLQLWGHHFEVCQAVTFSPSTIHSSVSRRSRPESKTLSNVSVFKCCVKVSADRVYPLLQERDVQPWTPNSKLTESVSMGVCHSFNTR